MVEIDPVSSEGPDPGPETGQPSWRADDRPASPPAAADPAFLAHLQSLHELQVALSQEERDEEVLRAGITGAVEIIGADCGLTLVDPPGGGPPLRFGWCEGRTLPQHEIEVLSRSLDEALTPLREGRVARVLLAADPRPGEIETAGEPPAQFQSRGFASLLALGIGVRAGRGVLVLARRDPAPFGRETILLAEVLSTQLSVQIERVRRTAEVRQASERVQAEVETATRDLQERNRELEALNAVAAASAPSLDPERQMEVVLRKAAEVSGHSAGAIFMVEPGEDGADALKLSRGFGDVAYLETSKERTYGRGDDLPGMAWETGVPVVLPDLAAEPGERRQEVMVRAGYRRLICVPLRARGRTLGVMELLADETRAYTREQMNLAAALGDQVALVFQNARMVSDIMRYSLDLEARTGQQARELERRDLEFRGLVTLADEAGHAGGLRELLDALLGRTLGLLGFEAGAVHLLDPHDRVLTLRAQRGFAEEVVGHLQVLRPGDSLAGRVATFGETVVPELPATDGGAAAPADGGAEPPAPDDPSRVPGSQELRWRAAIPLRSRGGLQGVLSVASAGERVIDPEEIPFLKALGHQIGIAIETARAPRDDAHTPAPKGDLSAQLVQAQKMESIGNLASGIAHDFNNIVGAILGYASHIRSLVTPDNPIFREAETIEQQARRAAELTNQLLAFARGSESTLDLVDLNEVIDETVSFLSKSIGPTIVLETHLDPDVPAVQADPGQMRQILLNVAVNAKDALPRGGRITFETRVAHLDERYVRSCPDLAAGDYVEIVVGDTGVGMPAEVVEHAFEPFFTTKTNGQGTGLGLSVVYGIVKNHHGHVTITSKPMIGTTLRIYLPSAGRSSPRRQARPKHAATLEPPAPPFPPPPVASAVVVPPAPGTAGAPPVYVVPPLEERPRLARPPAPPAGLLPPPGPASGAPPGPPAGAPSGPAAGAPPGSTAGAPPGPAPGKPAASRRILVVDDEPAIREMARDILQGRGYEVIPARDGVEALDIYRQQWGRIDLVVLDMVMPRLGGLETFRRLLGIDRNVRVVLCSGHADTTKAKQAIKEGALGFFAKPFTMSELLAWVEKVLRREGPRPD